jgi:hypothetical protein
MVRIHTLGWIVLQGGLTLAQTSDGFAEDVAYIKAHCHQTSQIP